MPDWQQIVSSKLSGLALEPEEVTQVLEEVAGHLEEEYQSLLSKDVPEKEAARRALRRVDDWQALKQMIESARKKENPMPKRVAQFWLPAFLTLLLSMVLLAVIQMFGPQPLNAGSSQPLVDAGCRGLRFLATLLAAYRRIGSVHIAPCGWLSASGLLFHRFPHLALFDLFSDRFTDSADSRRPRCPQHHDPCIFCWSICVGDLSRRRASCRWLACAFLRFGATNLKPQCRRLRLSYSSNDKTAIQLTSSAARLTTSPVAEPEY